MSSPEELEALIARISLRDREAFRTLYVLTSAKLFGICLRILSDRNAAEDAVQETYIKVWNRAGTFASGKGSVITWLAAIARNQAIDKVRARRSETGLDDAPELADDAPSPERSAIASDEYRRLSACLGELKPEHAEAVRRTYLGGWTYRDAASKLDVPLNTVKTWIRRGLISLRECLER